MFKIEIETDNATFAGGKDGEEIHRILCEIRSRWCHYYNCNGETPPLACPIIDINGNTVGSVTYEPSAAE